MTSKSTIGYLLSGGVNSVVILREEPVNEIKLIGLTDWSWVLLLSTFILVVWILIVFQARSKGAHEFGLEAGPDDLDRSIDQDDEHKGTEITELEK